MFLSSFCTAVDRLLRAIEAIVYFLQQFLKSVSRHIKVFLVLDVVLRMQLLHCLTKSAPLSCLESHILYHVTRSRLFFPFSLFSSSIHRVHHNMRTKKVLSPRFSVVDRRVCLH